MKAWLQFSYRNGVPSTIVRDSPEYEPFSAEIEIDVDPEFMDRYEAAAAEWEAVGQVVRQLERGVIALGLLTD